MSDPRSLIATARFLLGGSNKGAPNPTRLRRAVSTAYYALFHTLARDAADSLLGKKRRAEPSYETIYRGFQHRLMREGCEAVDKPTLGTRARKAMGAITVSPSLRYVASVFVILQDRRHWADYSPSGKITRREAADLVDLAALGMAQFSTTATEERRNFLAYLMSGVRS